MWSIHLYLSSTVKNPCSKTNWHSSVVYCEEIITGMGRQTNPMLWSQPRKKARNGLWLIRGQMGWIPSCMQTRISMANLVNFRRAHPCHSLMEYTCGYCCCCRSSLLSLRWANVDPPVELKADHTFLHLQGDYLSLQWLRAPLGQTNMFFLHPHGFAQDSLKWWVPWLIYFGLKGCQLFISQHHDITRDRWKLWPTCPLTITICDEKVTTCLWSLTTNVTWC